MGRFRHITDYYIETFGPDLATIQWCKEIIERNGKETNIKSIEGE